MKVGLALGALVLLVASIEAKPKGYEVFAKQEDSCVGQCSAGLVPGAPCQCNAACGSHNDCCSDYPTACLSCVDRCGIDYFPEQECQCNNECESHGNCCNDYAQACEGFTGSTANPGDTTVPGGGDGDLSNAQLKELSERLIKLNDASGINAMVTTDPAGSTSQCSTSDKAPNPFFTTWDEAIWDLPTVAALKALYDNYIPDVRQVEDHTEAEQAEESAFLDAVMASDIMVETYNTLFAANVFTGDMNAFRAKIVELWFDGYDRDGTSADVVGSSGFEHVFMGELKQGDVSGFHNWFHFHFEEEATNINYLGNLSAADFAGAASGITDVFTWNGNMKCIGSMFVGTLPELDLAVYTTCFLTRGGSKCTMAYNGVEFYITTFDLVQNGKVHIGTAYPDFT